MGKKLTNEEFLNKVKNLTGNEYNFLDEYINNKMKLTVVHNSKECNFYKYKVKPHHFLEGSRCPICVRKNNSTKRAKTDEEFRKEVYDLVKNEYKVITKYEKSDVKITFEHFVNGTSHLFDMRPSDFLFGHRCPKCMGNQPLTHKQFLKRIKNLYDDEYTVLDDYINISTKIYIQHNNSFCNNYKWKVQPASILKGRGCPICARKRIAEKQTMSSEEFLNRFKNLVGDEYILLEDYKEMRQKIKIRHNSSKCNNYKWEVLPANFLAGNRCPKCNESKGEKAISNYLSLHNINYKAQYKIEECKNINALPFDFAIFDKSNNLLGLIEYDGEQHFKPIGFGNKDNKNISVRFHQTQLRDSIKTNYCKDNNIPLLRIKYTQFDNINDFLDEYINKVYKNNI